jgi:hypothetical protein
VSVALANGASAETVGRLLELPETADFLNEEQLHRELGVRVPGEHLIVVLVAAVVVYPN